MHLIIANHKKGLNFGCCPIFDCTQIFRQKKQTKKVLAKIVRGLPRFGKNFAAGAGVGTFLFDFCPKTLRK